jgi:hypothetical protein
VAIDEENIRNMRERVYNSQDGLCYHCGRPLNWCTFQLAHVIPQRAWCLAKYGAAVIHHRKNFHGVCGLECNSAIQCNPDSLEAEQLAEEIRRVLP